MSKRKIFLLVSIVCLILAIFYILIIVNKTYKVKFDSNGGSVVESQVLKKNEKVVKPKNPIRDGYVFVYWTYNGVEYNFNVGVNKDMMLVAKWEKLKEGTYIVSFNTDGGNYIESQIINKDEQVTKPTDPVKDGYKFRYWSLNNKEYDFDSKVTNNIELTAVYEEVKKYIVTFNSTGGSNVASQTINYNGKVTKPSNPTKTGYTFKEWQLDGNTYNFDGAVTKNITLTAVWEINKYTVTFNSNGGSNVASQTINYNSKVTKPSNPTKTGYTFVRWTLDDKEYDFNSKVDKNLTLVANWESNNVPIRSDGTINNEYWNIKKDDNNFSDAVNTRNNINKVIEYASNNGISDIKLETGNYYINIDSKVAVNGKGWFLGIRMRNNVNFDLNNSTIYLLNNSLPSYEIILFNGVNNASISNGVIIGDRETHSYTTDSTHEHGVGVYITKQSSNITVFNLNISSVTGDGIYISNDNGSLNEQKISYNAKHSINIINNDLHYFRRNGISIISGNDIFIYKNKIHDCFNDNNEIKYTKSSVGPRAAIDMERNNINQMYSNIFIMNNKMYDVYGNVLSIEDNIFNLYYANNEVSKGISFSLGAGKAYTASGDYAKNDYSTFKVCNTYADFINNTSSTIINNKLININEVAYTNADYYKSDLTNDNLYNALIGIEKIEAKIPLITLKNGTTKNKIYKDSIIIITPSNAKYKKIYWTIEDESIISWSSANTKPIDTALPYIDANNIGETYLIGTAVDGSNANIKIKVIVS